MEFAWLVKALWGGQYKSVSPRDFKVCDQYTLPAACLRVYTYTHPCMLPLGSHVCVVYLFTVCNCLWLGNGSITSFLVLFLSPVL